MGKPGVPGHSGSTGCTGSTGSAGSAGILTRKSMPPSQIAVSDYFNGITGQNQEYVTSTYSLSTALNMNQ